MNLNPRLWSTLFVFLIVLSISACSGDDYENIPPDGDEFTDGDGADGDSAADGDTPLTEIMGYPIDETFVLDSLSDNVAVAWDHFGVPHVYGNNLRDTILAIGYVQASMRMVQMDFFRKVPRGRLSAFISQPVQDLLNYDLINRMYFSTREGQDIHQAIYDSLDDETKDLLQAYSDGVNLRLARYREDPSDWAEPFNFPLAMVTPDDIADWEPVDTVAIARLQTWDLSGSYNGDIDRSLLYEVLGEDLYNDLILSEPGKKVSIMPHEGSFKSARPARSIKAPLRGKGFIEVLNSVRKQEEMERRLRPSSQQGASNNWTVAPKNGVAYVCNDPHLSLYSPSVFIPMTANVREMSGNVNELFAGGVGFPGTPIFAIGRNHDVAWGVTVVGYDVKDVYLETVTYSDQGEPLSVLFNGSQVDVIKVEHTIDTGHGITADTTTLPLYFVPHHGPIIPSSMNTTDGTALTLRWTGQDVSAEIKTFIDLHYAKNIDEAFTAIEQFQVGAQNFVLATTEGDIGYYPHAKVPIRDGDLYEHPPWMVLPGDGSAEWTGYIPEDELPKLKNPEAGFAITANNDPTGSTLDNDPLNDDHYWMFSGATGYRAYGAKSGLLELMDQDSYDWTDMAEVQGSYYSHWANDFAPVVLALVDRYNLAEAMSDQATTALGLLRDWSYRMVSGVSDYKDPASAAVEDEALKTDAAAATYWNHLWVRLNRSIFMDELSAASAPFIMTGSLNKATMKLLRALHDDDIEHILIDDVSTAEKETMGDLLGQAIEMAVQDVLSKEEFSGATIGEAYWGRIHTLSLNHPLSLMTQAYNHGPFAESGGPYTVNVANYGPGIDPENQEYDFTHGPSFRFINAVSSEGIQTHFVIPGGVDERSDSDHFLDMFDLWSKNEYTEMHIDWADVKEAGIEKMTALVPAQ